MTTIDLNTCVCGSKICSTPAACAAVERDAYWHCRGCGDHGPAEPPYEVGDKEPCIVCGDGVAEVMTVSQAAKYESEIARGLRSRERAYTG